MASSRGMDGASAANWDASQLLAGHDRSDISVESREIFQLGSYLLDHRHLRLFSPALDRERARRWMG